jgi:hypothetical protein
VHHNNNGITEHGNVFKNRKNQQGARKNGGSGHLKFNAKIMAASENLMITGPGAR